VSPSITPPPKNGGGPRRLVVLGPTASGKSDVAMAIAREHSPQIEIVAVDAMQVYRHMDIGTAKPTTADRAAVVHHGLDLVDPDQDFAVTDYAAAATQALADIKARSATALLVGGTGLYLRSLTDPMEVPGRWPDVREQLEQRLIHEPVEVLHAELAGLDPDAAAKMQPSNTRRVVRALEVCLGSGCRFSSFGPGIDTFPPVAFVQVGLRWPRPLLTQRIERRVQAMIEAGLVAEVAALIERYTLLSRTARQALGYKELIAHLDGKVSLDHAVAEVVVRTRQFAVRQERWFRRDPRVQWIDINDDPVAEAVPVIRKLLSS
jgi:tRNA dimethylallyltransferase